jgi:hypothetical protein
VRASSTYDAAHLWLNACKAEPRIRLSAADPATSFEIVIDHRIYRVTGANLKKRIEKRRREWNGPRGFLFNKRPMLE